MSLRIVGGKHRGRKLYSLPGKATRPTPEIVREALFNILADEIPGSRFVDLFAGTGAVGLEALSRGAERVSFVEKASGAQAVLRRNLALVQGEERARLYAGDAYTYRDLGEVDFVFAAPPYGEMECMGRLAQHLQRYASPTACWILQHPKAFDISDIERFWALTETRFYGSNALSFFYPRREE